MLPAITIAIDQAGALAALERVARFPAAAPILMRQIAGTLHAEVEENFDQQGRPRWAPLKPGSLDAKYMRELVTKKGNVSKGGVARFVNAKQQNKILIASGQLASSIVMTSSATQAMVGTSKIYAAIHQFGGKTRPHRIAARRKKALAFGGIMRKAVNHPGSNIPARPFLALGPGGAARIESQALRYLQSLIQPR